MLSMSGHATVKMVKLRKETRDDALTKAVSLKLEFKAMPLDVVEAGFVSQLSLFYGSGEDPKIVDLGPLPVSRHVSNVAAVIHGVLIDPAIVDKVTVEVLPGRLASVVLWVKGPLLSGADVLHDGLGDVVNVSLTEREFIAEGVQKAA